MERVDSQFELMLSQINLDIIDGKLDLGIEKLKAAVDYYIENDLKCEFINVFEKGSNVIEAASKRALLLEQFNRIIDLCHKYSLKDSALIYYRYYALAQAFYGSPQRGLDLIHEAETLVTEDSFLSIELRNAKGLILSELDRSQEALDIFIYNFEESKRLNYKAGYRFVHNIGTAYHELGFNEKAIPYILKGIDYDLELNYLLNAVNAMIELSKTYDMLDRTDDAVAILQRANQYKELSTNQFLYKSYCEMMFILMKKQRDYEKALYYHERYMALEIQLNMDRYSGMIAELNMKYDISAKDKEYDLIKSKNYDLEMMGKKLENMNDFLQTTLDKSRAMRQDLESKNQELESTMASLNMTQEKLVLAEKRAALDQMFINIAHHMSTPLGVMNTTMSHMKLVVEKTDLKFKDGKISRGDLTTCLGDSLDSLKILDESLKKVVGFVDTLRLYKTDDEEEAVDVELKSYFTNLIDQYKKTKGVEVVRLDCPEDIILNLNVSLLNKCIDLISDKLIATSSSNSFDIEISKEINMISIGLGDFTPLSEDQRVKKAYSVIDTYDFYIIQTIVENLMSGRFIRFEDRGQEYFQFIFHSNS